MAWGRVFPAASSEIWYYPGCLCHFRTQTRPPCEVSHRQPHDTRVTRVAYAELVRISVLCLCSYEIFPVRKACKVILKHLWHLIFAQRILIENILI